MTTTMTSGRSKTNDIGTLITTTPGLHNGCPHIIGKGITVRRIVTWYKRGLNSEEIADRIGTLSLAEVYAALAYYHANTEAIEADIAAEAAEADRLENSYSLDKSPTQPILEFFEDIHRQGPFRTGEEIDRDLQEEGDSWDN
jgi:uncharacterized protein (DUF433 family)